MLTNPTCPEAVSSPCPTALADGLDESCAQNSHDEFTPTAAFVQGTDSEM